MPECTRTLTGSVEVIAQVDRPRARASLGKGELGAARTSQGGPGFGSMSEARPPGKERKTKRTGFLALAAAAAYTKALGLKCCRNIPRAEMHAGLPLSRCPNPDPAGQCSEPEGR